MRSGVSYAVKSGGELSGNASVKPSGNASVKPSGNASVKPSGKASVKPSGKASVKPSGKASVKPSGKASVKPSGKASVKPSGILLLLLLVGLPAQAHDARPIYVEILQTAPFAYDTMWKVPASMPVTALPSPRLPSDCTTRSTPRWKTTSSGHVAKQSYQCEQALTGNSLGIRFPSINPSLTTLISVSLLTGDTHFKVLKPGEESWTVPATVNRLTVASQYTGLGIQHIWVGLDHLLFVACLVLIAGTLRRLLVTITGFTLAHSVTLAASTLGWVELPAAPVEAAIALSVVFLAWEIAKGSKHTLTAKHPIAVSVSFGLLHGFGFASVLREIGLPSSEVPTALLFFNVGVELGQLMFVLALAASYRILRPLLHPRLPSADPIGLPDAWAIRRPITLPACYAIGSLASFWMFSRLTGFWA